MNKLQSPRILFILLFLIITIFTLSARTDEELGLHSDGGPWNFYPAKHINEDLPNILLIGDSIMNGYQQVVIQKLKRVANVDYWLTPKHLKSEGLLSDLSKIASYREYAVIHFNIGLHGWPEGLILKDEYSHLLQQYVSTIKQNAPNAHLIWASTTPVTEPEKPILNAEINPVIVERNAVAKQLMNSEEISVNDLYTFGANNLEISRGDKFHWNKRGAKKMGKLTVACIKKELR